jgi:hypothetical protein
MNRNTNIVNANKASKLVDWLINPVTTAEKTTLAGTLGVANKGLFVYDTDLEVVQIWNGSLFKEASAAVLGAVTYKGAYTDLATEPATSKDGDLYAFTGTPGTLAWAGITFSPNGDVQVGDQIIRRSATQWDVIQGNVIDASETVKGIIEIATQAETDAGLLDDKAVTPVKLKNYVINKGIVRGYGEDAVTFVAGTPKVITHNLNLVNAKTCSVEVKNSAGEVEGFDVSGATTNTVTVTSNVAGSGYYVFVTGLSATIA